jgi:hypothetical protein
LYGKFKPVIYAKLKELSGSVEKKTDLICFPCLLFGGDTTCTKNGVADLKHLDVKLEKIEDFLFT